MASMARCKRGAQARPQHGGPKRAVVPSQFSWEEVNGGLHPGSCSDQLDRDHRRLRRAGWAAERQAGGWIHRGLPRHDGGNESHGIRLSLRAAPALARCRGALVGRTRSGSFGPLPVSPRWLIARDLRRHGRDGALLECLRVDCTDLPEGAGAGSISSNAIGASVCDHPGDRAACVSRARVSCREGVSRGVCRFYSTVCVIRSARCRSTIAWLVRILPAAVFISNHAARSTSGNALRCPDFGGHSISKRLLVSPAGSKSLSTAHTWTIFPPV